MNETEETLNDVYGEAAPEDSSPETTEEVSEETPEETTEESNDTVPYNRFSEVNNKYREAETRAEQAERELQEIKAQQEQEQTPEETPKEFESAQDLIEYQDKKVEQKLDQSLQNRDIMWNAKLEAQNKMNQLEQEFPEIKEDAMFAEIIRTKIQNDPSQDIIEAANEVKQYFKTFEKQGRQIAEKELAQRGGFQGGVTGNKPMQQTDEDKEYAQKIVDASGGADSTF